MKGDEIHIAGLALDVHIGVTERERAQPQRVTVFITLRQADGFTDLKDQIERTINYSLVCATVRKMATDSPPRQLIETLAADIATLILACFSSCAEVDVELRKYILPDTDYVAVRLTRRRRSP